jgi:hypothetical protein
MERRWQSQRLPPLNLLSYYPPACISQPKALAMLRRRRSCMLCYTLAYISQLKALVTTKACYILVSICVKRTAASGDYKEAQQLNGDVKEWSMRHLSLAPV